MSFRFEGLEIWQRARKFSAKIHEMYALPTRSTVQRMLSSCLLQKARGFRQTHCLVIGWV